MSDPGQSRRERDPAERAERDRHDGTSPVGCVRMYGIPTFMVAVDARNPRETENRLWAGMMRQARVRVAV